MVILCCVAKKHTKEQLSPIMELECSQYDAVNTLNATGLYPQIDGNETYLDYVVLDGWGDD